MINSKLKQLNPKIIMIIIILIFLQISMCRIEIVKDISAKPNQIQKIKIIYKLNNLCQNMVTSRSNNNFNFQIEHIEDNFFNESKISFKDNIIVDTNIGEVKLFKINKSLGGDYSDYGKSVQRTSDGGYIIVGVTKSYGNGEYDIWLIKLNGYGVEQWNKTFGGNRDDYGNFVQQTSDGGYIIVGSTESFSVDNYDVWLIKIDEIGNIQWNNRFGGIFDDVGNSVGQTSDGGYIIIGYTEPNRYRDSDVWLIKTDNSGVMEWNRTYGGWRDDMGNSILETSDSGYIIIGSTESFGSGGYDVWLIKTNNFGKEEWNVTFGGNEDNEGTYIEKTSDGGYIIVGTTYFCNISVYKSNIWLIKTDSFGNVQWDKIFKKRNFNWGKSIQQTNNNGYILIGRIYSNSLWESDVWVIKTDNSGKIKWDRIFGGSNRDDAFSAQESFDGGYIIFSTTYPLSLGNQRGDLWLVRINRTGNIQLTGELISNNLFNEKKVYYTNSLDYNASIPSNTSIKIQFSQGKMHWFNSRSILNGWDFLSDGFNRIDLNNLSFEGPGFYYKLIFSSNNMNIPILKNISITYIPYSDTDSDNIPDAWEIYYGFNPFNASDAFLDIDDDGFNNREEYKFNTDPSNPDDYPIKEKDNNSNYIKYIFENQKKKMKSKTTTA